MFNSTTSPFKKASSDTLPLLWLPDKNNVFYIRNLKFDETSKMLSGHGVDSVTMSNVKDYGKLLIASIENNERFKNQIDLLYNCFDSNRNNIGKRISDFIEEKHGEIEIKVAEITKLSSWALGMDDVTSDIIFSQIQDIPKNNIFK